MSSSQFHITESENRRPAVEWGVDIINPPLVTTPGDSIQAFRDTEFETYETVSAGR